MARAVSMMADGRRDAKTILVATSGHEAGRVADGGLLSVLVFDPHLVDDARGAGLVLVVLDYSVRGETIARVDRLDEGHRHGAAAREARTQQIDHQLRHVGRRHHALGQTGAESLLARPGLVAVNGARLHAGV